MPYLFTQTSIALLLGTLLLSACSGGGSNDGSGTPQLSGRVLAAEGTLGDSDTNDPFAPQRTNNHLNTAQTLSATASVGGFVGQDNRSADSDLCSQTPDPCDLFSIELSAGQRISLTIADHTGGTRPDLDLLLLNADGSVADASDSASNAVEQLSVASSGSYYIVVLAFAGESNYTLSVTQAGLSLAEPQPRAQVVPGELLVRFNSTVIGNKGNQPGIQSAVSALGLQQVGSAMGQTALVRLPSNSADQQRLQQALATPATLPFHARDPQLEQRLATVYAAKALARRTDIESADPNYLYQPQALPNDPFYGRQWHYPLINLPQAWDIETGSSNPVIVAVVDTGVVLSHPDLQGQLVAGYDFISDLLRAGDGNGIDSNPDDPGDNQTPGSSSFHGTHVAGTIAAGSNNGFGVAGVAWGAKIMPIRVLGQGGGTSNDILQGVRYAAGLSNSANQLPATPASIINLSLGCNGCFSATEAAAYADIVRDSGVILIAAAGNENSSQPSYPAAYPDIISVAAVDRLKARAPYSNFGSSIDVAAPGGDNRSDADGDGYPDGILSTAGDDSSGSRQATYLFQNGTSMAAPHMSGVVALMKAVNPDFITLSQLEALLSSGALTEDVAANGASVRDDIYGYGLIDALKAVQAAQNGVVPTTLTLSPNALTFGPFTSSQQLTLGTTGDGSITVNSLTSSVPWLSASGSGIGAYSISVDRSGLSDGNYPSTLIINYSINGSPRELNIPVSMQVGNPTSLVGDTGYTYIILIDTQSGETVASVDRASVNGEYSFSFSRVPPGDYLLVAGSDADNDGFICDAGESCGGYPTLAQLQPLTITTDLRRSGVEFVSAFEVLVGNASVLEQQPLARGYPRQPQTQPRDKQWSRTP